MVISSERLVERIERLLERMLLMRARLLERTLTWSHTYMIAIKLTRTHAYMSARFWKDWFKVLLCNVYVLLIYETKCYQVLSW